MQRIRHQTGHIFKKGRAWYVRFYDSVFKEGKIIRLQRCKKITDIGGAYTTKRSVRELAAELLKPINEGTQDPVSTMSLADYIEQFYLPYVEDQKRASTLRGYRNLFRRYIKPRGNIALRDFRTVDGERLMIDISRKEDLSRPSLGHIKSFLSGVFRYSRRQGVLNTPNPMRDVSTPKARAGNETYAYTLEEIKRMIEVLPLKAATIVAVAGLTGIRKGELRGLLWENYDGQQLQITRSIWRSHVDEPKTPKSKWPVPVIQQLATRLERYRLESGNPRNGLIFPNGLGNPINLDQLAFETIKPILKKAGIVWHGWHAFRRGLATNLHRLGVKDKDIQAILRHSNLSTTMNIYVKSVSVDAAAAMDTLNSHYATTVQPALKENTSRPN